MRIAATVANVCMHNLCFTNSFMQKAGKGNFMPTAGQNPGTRLSGGAGATEESRPDETIRMSSMMSRPEYQSTKTPSWKGGTSHTGGDEKANQTGAAGTRSTAVRSGAEDTLDSISCLKMANPMPGAPLYEKKEYLETQLDSLLGQQILEHFTVLGGMHNRLTGGRPSCNTQKHISV